jgi:hypothetical protein
MGGQTYWHGNGPLLSVANKLPPPLWRREQLT